MDKYTKEAAEQIPVGFYRVIGRVYPSDLAWSWTSKEWVRVDSPDWLHKPGPYASMNVCVIRDKYAAEPEPVRVVRKIGREEYESFKLVESGTPLTDLFPNGMIATFKNGEPVSVDQPEPGEFVHRVMTRSQAEVYDRLRETHAVIDQPELFEK